MLTKEDLENIGLLFEQKVDRKIEELAIMVARGFEEVQKQLALKADKTDIDRILQNSERIEHKVYLDHEIRIEKLENGNNFG